MYLPIYSFVFYLKIYKCFQREILGSKTIFHNISLINYPYIYYFIIHRSDGMSDLWLKCDGEDQYSQWMAACRVASRGKKLSDCSYDQVGNFSRWFDLESVGTL